MGSKEYQDESPPHAVFLDGYFLQQLEVTQAQYRRCVEAGACPEAASGEACNWGRDDRDDHPANCISWFDASRYCSWAGMRLPTEAEWEKGARGTFGFSYPWGNTPPGDMRAANRYRMPPLRWYPYVGVRCATLRYHYCRHSGVGSGHRIRSSKAFRLAPEKPLCTTPGGGCSRCGRGASCQPGGNAIAGDRDLSGRIRSCGSGTSGELAYALRLTVGLEVEPRAF